MKMMMVMKDFLTLSVHKLQLKGRDAFAPETKGLHIESTTCAFSTFQILAKLQSCLLPIF